MCCTYVYTSRAVGEPHEFSIAAASVRIEVARLEVTVVSWCVECQECLRC